MPRPSKTDFKMMCVGLCDVAVIIEQMKRAGIKVWVLTGDKVETARTIGFSCNLLKKDMHIHELLVRDAVLITKHIEDLEREIKCNSDLGDIQQYALVVSGDALIPIMESIELSKKFNNLAQKCASVLCCRVSPKQKQQIVKLVKTCVPYARTLAIGDGANDVNMITEAHVGLGTN